MEKLTLLLDGDVFAYQAAVQSQTQIEWSDDQATLTGDLGEARVRLDDRIAWIREKLNGTRVIVALSDIGSGYWRRQVLPSYKQNRASTFKPFLLKPLREYLQEHYECKIKPMLEGDDVLGILATHPKLVPGRKYIVSEDKDMKTIPGTFARINRKEHKVDINTYSEHEADYYHMLQTLTGDSSDGYKGCPKVGPVGAVKILGASACFSTALMWPLIVAAYQKAGLTEDDALVQARVARILRWTDYDYATKQPILWKPKKGTNADIKTENKDRGADPQQASEPVAAPANT